MSILQVNGEPIVIDKTNLPDASTSGKGAVKQGASVAKLQYTTTQDLQYPDYRLNGLIASLREANSIANDKFIIVYNMNLTDEQYEDKQYGGSIFDYNIYEAGDTAEVYWEDPTEGKGVPYLQGYKFIGWSTLSSTEIPEFPYDESNPQTYTVTFIDNDIILYAVWERLVYTLTYNLGSLGSGSVPVPQTAEEGGEVFISFSPAPTVNDGSGRVFVGWSTTDESTSPVYLEWGPNSTYLYTNVELYPVFAYKITYHLGEYATGDVPNPQYGQEYDVAYLDFQASIYPTSGSNVFCGWATTDGLTHYNSADYTADGSNSVTLTQNVDLYPVFSMRYRLLYVNGNDSTGSLPESRYAFEDQTINVEFSPYPSCISDPSKAFLGWSTTDGDSTPEYSSSLSTQITLTNDVILYPVFGTLSYGYITIDNSQASQSTEIYHYENGQYSSDLEVYGGNSDDFVFTPGISYYIVYKGSSSISSTFTGTYSGMPGYESASLTTTSGEDPNYNYVMFIHDPSSNQSWTFGATDVGTITIVESGSGH